MLTNCHWRFFVLQSHTSARHCRPSLSSAFVLMPPNMRNSSFDNCVKVWEDLQKLGSKRSFGSAFDHCPFFRFSIAIWFVLPQYLPPQRQQNLSFILMIVPFSIAEGLHLLLLYISFQYTLNSIILFLNFSRYPFSLRFLLPTSFWSFILSLYWFIILCSAVIFIFLMLRSIEWKCFNLQILIDLRKESL